MTIRTIFFDLDDTLYEDRTGLWDAIHARMSLFMIERLRLPEEQVPALRDRYYKSYGTTLRGLQIHHQVDPEEYLAYVHDLPLGAYLQPEPALREMLLRLPQRRWIFTNGDSRHAARVLNALDLEGCFEGIVDVRAMQFVCKPDPEAYQRALALASAGSPQECMLLDDALRNLEPAHSLGFTTVLVGMDTPHPAANYSIARLLDLQTVAPFLWETHSGNGHLG